MIKKKPLLLLSVLALSACAGQPTGPIKDGQYWQRVDSASLIYTQGPKAQQSLNRDIAACVVELRELERLGSLKNGIPAEGDGTVLSADERALLDWDTPERDQYMFSEHGNYDNFEACMLSRGWERVLHVPFDVARRAQENYYRSNVNYADDYAPATERPATSNEQEPYGVLNN
ncbi:MAG: hypothetical protein L6Q57_01105 [Alphaproteobacteria bacterium]|nr:hypothetical protein [Alphaproteobacteria bacterium]